MGRKQDDSHTKHSKPMRGKPRPSSTRQPRKDFSSKVSVYHCEVYGLSEGKSGACNFLSPHCKDNDGMARKKRYQWIKRHQTCVLNDSEVFSARPVYRVHSAPRKLAYLHRVTSKRAPDTSRAGSPGAIEDLSRPQTAAPIVREFTDIRITGDTWESSGDLLSSRPSTVDLTSDKHRSFSPEYNTDCEFEQFRRVDRENSDVAADREYETTDNEDNLINDPLKAIIESFTKRSDKSQAETERKEPDLTCESPVNEEVVDDMRKSETRGRVTFAQCCLAETKYIHRKEVKTKENNHVELIEKLRQSYGMEVEDKSEKEADTSVKPHTGQNADLSIENVSETTPKQTSTAADNVNKCLPTIQNRLMSTIHKVPFKKSGKAQGFLVKHLREQRIRKANKRNGAPIAANDQTAGDDNNDRVKKNVSGLFLRTATFIWYACRLLSCMVDLSSELTTRSATEEQWHALNTSREARGMAFNKAAFAKRKDFTRVPKWAKRIMRKGPEDRSEQDVKRIHALLRGLKSFDRFTEKIQLSMCKSFVYYSIKSGRVVLRQGHVGQNFYFMFNGSVFVNIDDVDAKGNKFSKTEAVLGRGDSFGELALLQDIRRTATITCREDCEMLVVDKHTFARICPRIFEMELDEKMRFVSKMKLFNLRVWDEESLRKMCFEAQIQEYKTNKVVVVDSEKDDWIYICMEGKCQVIRRLDLYHEIEWRKLNQHQMRGKTSRRMSRQDFLTVMTGMSNPSFRPKENPGSRRRSVSPAVKQNLLDSMGLEFLQNRRLQQMRNRRSSKADLSTSLCQKGEYGPLTLTSLLANDEKRNGNHLFLNIHTVRPYDVFDLASVLKNQEEIDESTGSHILVSLGSRLMRIKRSSYFKYASPDAIELAKGLAFKYMYPSDDVLLEQYRDFLRWEVYKYQVLQVALNQKKKSLDDKKLPQTVSNTSTIDTDKARALFELNKSTLAELNGILNTEEETNLDSNFKHMEELNSENARRRKSSNTSEQTSILPSITLSQPQIQSGPELSNVSKQAGEQKLSHRRMSRVSMASEFKTIDETDEKD